MKKRLQVIISDESWALVEAATQEANSNFELGNISFSDVINEMILTAKIDIKAMQNKHTNLRKSLRMMAAKDMDLDAVIKSLLELKAKGVKKRSQTQNEVGIHE